MKLKALYLYTLLLLALTACKKDLGNYDYSPPSEPVVTGLKSANFGALLGDTLTIKPAVVLADADPLKDLDFEWHINIQERLKDTVLKGYPLKMIYNLGPGSRISRLLITDKRNGLFYNYPFTITGTTQFSKGMVVLSDDHGVAKLSFVKPDNTILVDIYQSLNKEALPGNPVQLYYSKPLPYQPNTKEEYWLLCQDKTSSGVVVDASTLLRKSSFAQQFFTPPVTIIPGYLEPFLGPVQMGTVPTGVINNKLYVGIQSTAPFADDYGKFANEQTGDYSLSQYFVHGSNYFLGYDLKGKSFVVFGPDGTFGGKPGTIHTSSTGFDPLNVGLDNLLYMKSMEGQPSYAWFKTPDGSITELSFSYPVKDDKTNTEKTFRATGKRVFKGASLVKDGTKWVANSLNVIYFSSGDKIYRYNPINEDLRALAADFGGKQITMLRISGDDNTLTAGADGAVYTLDVGTAKPGNITKTVSGIPGAPVDILIR